jgi:hypothetical protein
VLDSVGFIGTIFGSIFGNLVPFQTRCKHAQLIITGLLFEFLRHRNSSFADKLLLHFDCIHYFLSFDHFPHLSQLSRAFQKIHPHVLKMVVIC